MILITNIFTKAIIDLHRIAALPKAYSYFSKTLILFKALIIFAGIIALYFLGLILTAKLHMYAYLAFNIFSFIVSLRIFNINFINEVDILIMHLKYMLKKSHDRKL